MSATATELSPASTTPATAGADDGEVVAVPIPQPQPESVASGAGSTASGASGPPANAKRFKIGNNPKPPRKIEAEEGAAAKDSETAGAAPAGKSAADRTSAASAEAPRAPKRPFLLFVVLYGLADGVLGLLNRPFAWVPNGARGAIGGAAVVTLMMAVAGGVGGPLLWPRNSALDAIERKKAELRAAEAAAAAAALEAAHAKNEPKKGEAKHGKAVEEKQSAGGH